MTHQQVGKLPESAEYKDQRLQKMACMKCGRLKQRSFLLFLCVRSESLS